MLQVLEEEYGQRVSDVTRHGIRLAYEEATRQRRIEAAQRLIAMEVEDVPDPDELSRQLADKYGPWDEAPAEVSAEDE
jgi:hypothetical protein